jgi:hypothetical protein
MLAVSKENLQHFDVKHILVGTTALSQTRDVRTSFYDCAQWLGFAPKMKK